MLKYIALVLSVINTTTAQIACTEAQLSGFQQAVQTNINVVSSCSAATEMFGGTTLDQICGYDECVAFASFLVENGPDCQDPAGANLQQAGQELVNTPTCAAALLAPPVTTSPTPSSEAEKNAGPSNITIVEPESTDGTEDASHALLLLSPPFIVYFVPLVCINIIL